MKIIYFLILNFYGRLLFDVNSKRYLLFAEIFFALHFHLNIFFFIKYEDKSPPSAYSIIKKNASSVSITSYNLIILKWNEFLSILISMFILCLSFLSFIFDFSNIFITTYKLIIYYIY